MVKQEFSTAKLAALIPTEADAYRLLEELRWGGNPEACPKCGGADRCSFLKPAQGWEPPPGSRSNAVSSILSRLTKLEELERLPGRGQYRKARSAFHTAVKSSAAMTCRDDAAQAMKPGEQPKPS